MSNKPDFAIITPSFNQGKYIEETILSVIHQEGITYEYVVMDGGSTDNSIDILNKYKDRFHYFQSQKDGGQASSINLGFSKTSAQIMSYINSDDFYSPGCLYVVKEYFDNHPNVDIIVGYCEVVDKNGKSKRVHKYKNSGLSKYFIPKNSIKNYIPQPATFWRRRVWEGIEPFNERYQNAFDYDYYLRALVSKFKIGLVNYKLVSYREHDSQKSSDRSLILKETIEIIKESSKTDNIDNNILERIDESVKWCEFKMEQIDLMEELSKTRKKNIYYRNLINLGLRYWRVSIKDITFYWAFVRPIFRSIIRELC